MLSTTKEHSLWDRLSTRKCENFTLSTTSSFRSEKRETAKLSKTKDLAFCCRQHISQTAFLVIDSPLLVVDNLNFSKTNSYRQLVCGGSYWINIVLKIDLFIPHFICVVGILLYRSLQYQAFCALLCLRALSPLFAGSVFAWSISKGYKHGFPLDEHLVFLLFSVVCFLCIVFSCMLPKGLNKRKEVPVKVWSCEGKFKWQLHPCLS